MVYFALYTKQYDTNVPLRYDITQVTQCEASQWIN